MRIWSFLLFIFLVSCAEKQEEAIVTEPNKSIDSKYLQVGEIQNLIHSAKKVYRYKLAKAPFDTLRYDKVIAYEFDGMEERNTTIYSNYKGFSAVVLRHKALNQKQVNQLTAFLSNEKTYGSNTAACFVPKLGIVFFKDDKVTFVIDVCLDCNYLKSTTEIPASVVKKRSLGDNIEIAENGFSIQGQTAIINLCKELGLEYGDRKAKSFE
jgi:hypothetical protein